MAILRYESAMAAELASAYNHIIRGVPHCYPVSGEDFASAVAEAAGEARSDPPLHSQAAFVASEGTAILGFIDLAIRPPKEVNEGEEGVIRFFWYEPGRRTGGQALLDAAEGYFRRHNRTQVEAFPQEYRYSFYHLEAAYLSDHLGQVGALLGSNGYKRARGEVYLDWPNYEPVEPTPAHLSADISIEWHERRGARPAVKVLARQGEKQIGICECGSCGEFTRAEEAQDWFYVESLEVKDEMQGKGLGRHLLQRALQEMHGVGYRHAAINTAWDNYRAFLFYSNCGYHVVDWTYGLRRELPER